MRASLPFVLFVDLARRFAASFMQTETTTGGPLKKIIAFRIYHITNGAWFALLTDSSAGRVNLQSLLTEGERNLPGSNYCQGPPVEFPALLVGGSNRSAA
jgi:hypothetical protein